MAPYVWSYGLVIKLPCLVLHLSNKRPRGNTELPSTCHVQSNPRALFLSRDSSRQINEPLSQSEKESNKGREKKKEKSGTICDSVWFKWSVCTWEKVAGVIRQEAVQHQQRSSVLDWSSDILLWRTGFCCNINVPFSQWNLIQRTTKEWQR